MADEVFDGTDRVRQLLNWLRVFLIGLTH